MTDYSSFTEIKFCGVLCVLNADASLYLPEYKALVIADLHLEKGQALSRAAPLPPFDTDACLAKLSLSIMRIKPETVIFLGDSFHTSQHAFQLSDRHKKQLAEMAKARNFIWITGNHDEKLPDFLPGRVSSELTLGPLYLCHQITGENAFHTGQICGHYHPKARLNLQAGKLSRPCFIHDDRRLILPAYGVYTGGLNILDDAIQAILTADQTAHFCHADKIFSYRVDRRVFLKS